MVLEPGADPRSVAAVLGIKPRNVYTAAVNGFAADLSAGQLNALRHNPRVAYVEPDAPARLATTQSPVTWGLDRIDQANLPLSNSFTYTSGGRGVRIYVLDTGVRLTHTEFGGRAAYISNGTGGNFVGDANVDAADCHGHGTHVAATAAGARYGVAKLALVRAGRVVDCAGNGNASMVIAALDWIILNGIKPGVVNMSLGYGNVQSVRDAAQAVYAAGYVPVAAAGNGDFLGTPQNACAQAPAGAQNALTVGSTRSDDTESSFSNYGRWRGPPGAGIQHHLGVDRQRPGDQRPERDVHGGAARGRGGRAVPGQQPRLHPAHGDEPPQVHRHAGRGHAARPERGQLHAQPAAVHDLLSPRTAASRRNRTGKEARRKKTRIARRGGGAGDCGGYPAASAPPCVFLREPGRGSRRRAIVPATGTIGLATGGIGIMTGAI